MSQFIIDLSNWREKAMLLDRIRELRGMHVIEITRWARKRTNAQNRLYWPLIVKPFCDWLASHGNEVTPEIAHEILKAMFLETSFVDQESGEMISYVRSTTDLNTQEFSEYIEKCVAYLSSECGIIVEMPDDDDLDTFSGRKRGTDEQ